MLSKAIKTLTQVDFRSYDRNTGNWDWDYFYRVEFEDGEIYETHGWHPEFAKIECKREKA